MSRRSSSRDWPTSAISNRPDFRDHRSDQIESSPGTPSADAIRTLARHDESVTCGSESVLHADGFAKSADLVIAEFDHSVALGAMEVVVRRISVIVFVGGPIGEPELAEQSCFDEEPERAIHGRAANPPACLVKVDNEFVGIEVLVIVKDVAYQYAPRLSELLAPDLEKLAELVFRAVNDG